MKTIETAKTEQQAQKLAQALKNRNFELELVTDGELKFYHPGNDETVIIKLEY